MARATGEVDGVRLRKEAYWALRATWSSEDIVHLIGHWTYPADTVKDMFAVAKADEAELFVNGRSLGRGERSLNTLFTWKDVAFEPGTIRVEAYRDGKKVAEQSKETAGPAVALKLTPILAPGGWVADGSDVALFDVEVVDAKGRRCPTDQARVDFEVKGPGIWRGSYNSGIEFSTNHLHFNTEAGVNRASVRSTLEASVVTVTARREGLKPATLRLRSKPISMRGGLLASAPANFALEIGERPAADAEAIDALNVARALPTPVAEVATANDRHFSTFAYTGQGVGGAEERLYVEALAYSDDALLYLDSLPAILDGARLLRTANQDRSYWANDYIVATAGRDLEFFVAHEKGLPVPQWLSSYADTGAVVTVNGKPFALYSKQLKKDDEIRISGNVDQGQTVGAATNLVMFSKSAE